MSNPEADSIRILNAEGIKERLRPWLLSAHAGNTGTVLIEELGIGCGHVRIDLAVVTPERFDAYEVKSEADSLVRLPRQVEAYSGVVDRAFLVAHPDHLGHALPVLPEWWGILTIGPEGTLEPLRPAMDNPAINPRWLVESLWRPEAARILEAKGASKALLRKPKHDLFDALIEIVPLEELKREIRTRIRTRPWWGREERMPRRVSIGYPPWEANRDALPTATERTSQTKHEGRFAEDCKRRVEPKLMTS